LIALIFEQNLEDMSKALKVSLALIGGLILVLFIAFKIMQSNTKKHSPEGNVSQKTEKMAVDIFYNRPFKKEREIFGGLVPYGEVWRTGANEATTFTTTADLNILGETLPTGAYTLWTIPGGSEWQIIFNSKMYSWGVNLSSEASREAEADVLQVTVPVQKLPTAVEQFTISLQENTPTKGDLILAWDKTKITVPLEAK
jgi:hypothetical protein